MLNTKFSKQKIFSFVSVAVIGCAVLLTFFPSCKNENPVARAFSSFSGNAVLGTRNYMVKNAKSLAAPMSVSNAAMDMDVMEKSVSYTSNSRMLTSSALGSNDGISGNGTLIEALPESNPKSETKNEKKLIRTGNISFEVDSLMETMKLIEQWVESYNGYISNKNEDSRNIYVCAHVPAVKFNEAMDSTGNFGKIVSKNVNSRDVTEQYYDLEGRLSTQKALLEKMKDYLKNAKNMNEILQIESKISSVTSEIERMTSQMKRLSGQIEYSQIDISAYLPLNQSESGFILPDTKSKAREFTGNILEFFASFIFNILYIIIYGTILSVLVIFIYWIAFGKIGLVRKLFEKVK